MGIAIGIDLGTTNCCVYFVEGAEPKPVLNPQGARTTPSVVAFTDRGVLVGAVAQRQAVTNPSRTIHAIKRLMGNKLEAPEVAAARKILPYETVAAPNGDAWIRVGGEDRSPQEVSSLLLAELKRMAEDRLGQEVSDAVITVPAFFNDGQRQATRDAGALAGLNVRRLLNEPTAAALAYGFDKAAQQTLAVVDLGGGTFDISILDVSKGVFEVLATSGDRFLGGEDFDRRLIELLLEEFKQAEGIDLREDRTAMQRIREAAQNAKHELSVTPETTVNLPFVAARGAQPLHLQRDVSRDELEALVQPELARMEAPCRLALQDACIRADEIDAVILVGGMTRMPAVERRVSDIFGKKPVKDINPDEVVAMGAALQASVLKGELEDVVLLDVTPHSLGLRVRGGRFSKVIDRNTRIPCRETKNFQPVEKGQPFVELEVYQGEGEMVKDNTYLGRFMLTDLPQPKTGGVQVAVSFDMDTDGILRVTAREPTSGREASVQIQPSSGLTLQQFEQIRSRRVNQLVDRGGDDASAKKAKVRFVDGTTEPPPPGYSARLGERSSPPNPTPPPAVTTQPAQASPVPSHTPVNLTPPNVTPPNVTPPNVGVVGLGIPMSAIPSQAPQSLPLPSYSPQSLALPAAPPRPQSSPFPSHAASRAHTQFSAGNEPVEASPVMQGPTPSPPPNLTPMPTSTDPQIVAQGQSYIGRTIAERYVVDELIGQGGMGQVFLSHHSVLNRRFAIKVLHHHLATRERFAARFLLEAQAASRIRHPNVVEITDFGQLPDGTSYFAMEYLDGVSLDRILRQYGKPTITEACDIARQVASALGAAHDLGIVHRDLKPENVILIERRGKGPLCKILDFGIAKTIDTDRKLTGVGQLIGTPIYMSPEQAQGLDVDWRSDIYTLGVMMYEMVCGQPPFDADTPLGVLRKHVTETPRPVRKLAPECPVELEWLIHQCLEKLPDARCQSMAELARELARIDGQPLSGP